MLKYIKPCNNNYKITAENIAELFETKCKFMQWDLAKEEIRSHWITLRAFIKGEFADYHSYLLLVYNDYFNNKEKVTFQEFFKYITE